MFGTVGHVERANTRRPRGRMPSPKLPARSGSVHGNRPLDKVPCTLLPITGRKGGLCRMSVQQIRSARLLRCTLQERTGRKNRHVKRSWSAYNRTNEISFGFCHLCCLSGVDSIRDDRQGTTIHPSGHFRRFAGPLPRQTAAESLK